MSESLKESDAKRLANLGEYASNGPGRPVGSKNRFTRIKESMAEIFEEEGGKEAFRKYFKSSFPKALDKIIAVMPKEPLNFVPTEGFSKLTIVIEKDAGSNDTSNQETKLRVETTDQS